MIGFAAGKLLLDTRLNVDQTQVLSRSDSIVILDDYVRTRIVSILRIKVRIVFPDELSAGPQRGINSIILIDCLSVLTYGVTVVSKVKFSCPDSTLVLLCNQDNRHLIGRVMELGAYGCKLEPYEEWELLTR